MGHLVRAALGRAIDVRSAPVGRGLVAGLMVFALFALAAPGAAWAVCDAACMAKL